jgi:hypothetical protein
MNSKLKRVKDMLVGKGANAPLSRSRWALSNDGAGEQRIPHRCHKQEGRRLSAPAKG